MWKEKKIVFVYLLDLVGRSVVFALCVYCLRTASASSQRVKRGKEIRINEDITGMSLDRWGCASAMTARESANRDVFGIGDHDGDDDDVQQ